MNKEFNLKVIDAHCHVNWCGHNINKVIQDMDANRIETAWVLTWETFIPGEKNLEQNAKFLDPSLKESDDPLPLKDVIRAYQRYPQRFIPFFAPHPKRPHACNRLKSAIGLHHIRGVGEWKFQVPLDDPDCIKVFRFAGEHGLPVIFHLEYPRMPMKNASAWAKNWYGGEPHHVESCLRQCPDTIFIGHGPGFWNEIADDADCLKTFYPRSRISRAGGRLIHWLDKFKNLWCDLSATSGLTALKRQKDGGARFLKEYSNRIIFGRDEFSMRLYGYLKELYLPQNVWSKITRENAENLVPLK